MSSWLGREVSSVGQSTRMLSGMLCMTEVGKQSAYVFFTSMALASQAASILRWVMNPTTQPQAARLGSSLLNV